MHSLVKDRPSQGSCYEGLEGSPYLGTNTSIKEATEVGPEVACSGVAKEVVLGFTAAAGVDVRLDAHATPVHQHVWDIPEKLCLDASVPETLPPYVTLHHI